MPFHSILISAHNRFDYLERTLESCLSSTDKDFELIIIDDASSKLEADHFYNQYQNCDRRITIYREYNNLGVGTRFEQLHNIANGKLLHLIGSDDLMHPLRLFHAKLQMEISNNLNDIMYSNAHFLNHDFRKLTSNMEINSPIMQKAWLFLQPKILHPTICSWHPSLSDLTPYRKSMRAAVDYAYYVDNFYESSFISTSKKLTYLVHSSSGISRDPISRKNQLNMHDIVMHTLWSKFVDCSVDDISIIRQLIVTPEFPRISFGSITFNMLEKIDHIIRKTESNILQSVKLTSFDFLKTEDDLNEYLTSIAIVFNIIRNRIENYKLSSLINSRNP